MIHLKGMVFLLLTILVTHEVSSQKLAGKNALILIDIQQFYFEKDKLPLEGNVEAAEKASELLEYCRNNGFYIVHIRHEGGGNFHPLVNPKEGETVIEKKQVNAFRGTNLLKVLKEKNIQNIVFAGMQTHMCLEAATRAADDFGFNCTVIEDACTTRDLEYEGHTITAKDVQYSTLNTLTAYANIQSLNEFTSKR